MSAATQRRVSAADVEGMDSCIRGLALALRIAIEREDCEITGLHFVQNEIEAITEQWARIRGPLPPAPPEEEA